MKSTINQKFAMLAILLGLSLGFIISSCSKSDGSTATPLVTTGLSAVIDTAQRVIATTSEGTQAGEYTAGSKATLNQAISAAQAVLANNGSTQQQITNATVNLADAVSAYRTNLIQPIAPANLIAYWKFNGNANDSSGNNHNGTITTGHAYYGAGVLVATKDRFNNSNSAYHFDHGSNIEVPFSAAFNPQQMTISLWCKPDTTGRLAYNSGTASTTTLLSLDRWYGWKFQFNPVKPFFTVCTQTPTAANNYAGIYINQDATVTLATVGSDWYHVVVTYTSGTMNFYVNGSLAHSWTGGDATGAPVTINPAVNLVIGQDLPTSVYTPTETANDDAGHYTTYVGWGGYWTGDMDDVMFYNTALTGPQVQALYNQQKTQ